MPEEEYIELDVGHFQECDADYRAFDDLPPVDALPQGDNKKEPDDVRRYEFKDDSTSDA